MDPFLDLIRLLRPQATLWTRVKASSPWGLSFRQREDLLFCWVEHGRCELIYPDSAPLSLQENDFVLVRTSTPFSLLSDVTADAAESETAIAKPGTVVALGSGEGPSTVLRGGRFVFDTANEQLLTGLLPQVVHVPSGADTSPRLRALLAMNEAESNVPRPGSDFVIARLMELVLVEILRSRSTCAHRLRPGLMAGLADPVTAQVLTAMHADVARPWTTEKLARVCSTSRSALGARFARVVGLGPIQYLQQWRMALAKDELRRGSRSIGEIALSVGFQSSSAFSTAFTRAVGCAPRLFAERSQSGDAERLEN